MGGKTTVQWVGKDPAEEDDGMVAFTYLTGSSSVSLPNVFWFGGVGWLVGLMWGSFLQEAEKVRC